jgi:transposase-like protein
MKKKPTELSAIEQQILADIQAGSSLQGALAPMIKRVMEAALEGELDAHLDEDKQPDNRRNGKAKKRIKSSTGEFELVTPRDRNGSFEPQVIKKRQTVLTDDLDAKILNLYANGLSYADIRDNLEEIYQVEISAGTINKITDRLLPELQEFRERPLETVYAVVYMDAIHFKLRENGRVVPKAIYTLFGVTSEGKKDILGLYINDSEGANFWAGVLASLKERGVEDILIACIDGLKGFPEAIEAIYPKTEIQLCVIHQIRNSLRYVASKDQKEFMTDLKTVYQASSKDLAEVNLLKLEEKWGKKYPVVTDSWNRNWEQLSSYFKYDRHVRKLIYTTNAIEGLHRMVRKYTKSKGSFTSENALLKLVFCAYKKILKKWTQPVQNWALIVSQLEIHFPNRLSLKLK